MEGVLAPRELIAKLQKLATKETRLLGAVCKALSKNEERGQHIYFFSDGNKSRFAVVSLWLGRWIRRSTSGDQAGGNFV
jgi:hypothetical protein